ncbi:MAG: GNAT family N-acetyltransferase, partial [Chloroflexota bacterium]|nr:GNAT family N-acetyltransferase [Chloroflexota bacterium]
MTDDAAMEVVAATAERWNDVEALLGVSGEAGCWCQAWRGFDAKAISGGKSREELLRAQMEGGPPSPGYLAYLDDLPVGWVGVSIRTETPRLMQSRKIPAIDDLPVWSIGCFRIRPGHRR